MPRLLLAILALLLAPLPAAARSLDREGTVSVLPVLRMASRPDSLYSRGLAPGLTVAFGFKPSRELRVGIDVGAGLGRGEREDGQYRVTAVPVLLAFDWILAPGSEVRPVIQAAIGREFIAITQDGYYAEHVPTILQVAAGLHADLSDRLGLILDGGYLHGRATDERLGRVDGGGPFVRLGVTFRFEPTRGPR